MHEENENDCEQPLEQWFSNFEDECLNELEAQGRVEARLQAAEENTAQQLWLGFQHTSTAIAQLYNYKVPEEERYVEDANEEISGMKIHSANDGYFLLVPFNKAAESLTKLYKDSLNNARECLTLGMQSGRSSRARDIAAWVRKKRKCIRRDELLAYLCGKSLPSHSHHHRNRQNRSLERQLPHRASHHSDAIDAGEYPGREAFSLQGLNGAMSNISMGYSRPSTAAGGTFNSFSRPPVVDYLYHDERAKSSEYRKRRNSSSGTDASMESPSRKKGKSL